MTPVKISLSDHTRGDTWKGILSIGPILVNGVAPSAAVVSARMQFRLPSGSIGYELTTIPTTGKGAITITNAATWSFIVPKQDLPLAAGSWEWDFECIDANGFTDTFYHGNLIVNADVSRG